MKDTTAITEQIPTPRLILLHLWPGVLGLIVRLLTAPVVAGLGLPPQYADIAVWTLLVILLGGYMLYLGRKKAGRPTLQGVVLYREPLPWWQYLVFTVILLIWAFAAIMLLTPLSTYLQETVFSWVPPIAPAFDTSAYSQSTLILMAVLVFILNPLYGGVVEESYYRGVLLPRMSRLGRWAPALNVVLWACTHLREPWSIPAFIVGFLPLAYFAWWKKNITASILVHTLGNLLNVLMLGAAMFSGAS